VTKNRTVPDAFMGWRLTAGSGKAKFVWNNLTAPIQGRIEGGTTHAAHCRAACGICEGGTQCNRDPDILNAKTAIRIATLVLKHRAKLKQLQHQSAISSSGRFLSPLMGTNGPSAGMPVSALGYNMSR
jgi:hypothetical protein